MGAFETRDAMSLNRRLQLLLVLLIAWDVLAIIAELSFGGFLFDASDGEITGLLGARGGFNGLPVVMIAAYAYCLARGPVRHRGVLWLAAIEQGAGTLFAVYHLATGDVRFEAAIVPLVVSAGLFVLVLVHMPRGQLTT